MRRFTIPALIGGSLLATAATAFAGDDNQRNEGGGDDDRADVLTVAVFGDSPYGTTPADTVEFQGTPAFIDSINADPKVGVVLHVGDIHSGKQYCTEAYNRAVFGLWKAFQDPLIYTPGDNEWADCSKVGEGGGAYNTATQAIDYVRDSSGALVDYAGGDPIANLKLIRSIFFAQPGRALGGRNKRVQSQAQHYDHAHPTDAKYVENVIWEDADVVFVTINLPGGSNNDNDVWYGAPTLSAAQSAEISERTGADLRWLARAFKMAADDDTKAVVIQAQADMWDAEKGVVHQAMFEPYVASIASHTLALGKPVLMLNGDSHVFRSDNPLSGSDPLNYMHPGYNVPNFHRIVVHGSTLPLEWLKLTIDPSAHAPQGPDAFGPFSWTRVIP